MTQSLEFLKKQKWKKGVLTKFVDILSSKILTVTEDKAPDGLKIHLADIYLDELEKVGSNEVTKYLLLFQFFLQIEIINIINVQYFCSLSNVSAIWSLSRISLWKQLHFGVFFINQGDFLNVWTPKCDFYIDKFFFDKGLMTETLNKEHYNIDGHEVPRFESEIKESVFHSVK